MKTFIENLSVDLHQYKRSWGSIVEDKVVILDKEVGYICAQYALLGRLYCKRLWFLFWGKMLKVATNKKNYLALNNMYLDSTWDL